MENKSFLEEKIAEKAREEIEKEWKDFVNMCSQHPIGKNLRIEEGILFAGLTGGHCNSDIFSCWMADMFKKRGGLETNAKEVLKKAIENRIAKKSAELLNKLENIDYLFNK